MFKNFFKKFTPPLIEVVHYSAYFETIDGSHTTKDNIEYIHTFIVNALKNSLLEEYFEKEAVTTNVDDEVLQENMYGEEILFDLSGRRVKHPSAGDIIIKNNKKIYIR